MAKREQVVAEELKNQHLAHEREKELQSIAQARVAYEQLMDEIRGYCQQARELREQAAELQRSGRTDFQVREEIQQLLNRAEHLDGTGQGTPSISKIELHERFSESHIIVGDGIKKGKGVSGAHNQDHFYNTLNQSGVDAEDLIIAKRESDKFPGLYEIVDMIYYLGDLKGELRIPLLLCAAVIVTAGLRMYKWLIAVLVSFVNHNAINALLFLAALIILIANRNIRVYMKRDVLKRSAPAPVPAQ